MTFKNWRGNLLYALILFVMLFIVIAIDFYIKEYTQSYFIIWPRILFVSLILPIVGLLFGLPSLTQHFKSEGKWKVNLGKILIICLPAFICANYAFIFFGRLNILYPIDKYLISESTIYIFQILLGHSFITSFYKEKTAPQLSEQIQPKSEST